MHADEAGAQVRTSASSGDDGEANSEEKRSADRKRKEAPPVSSEVRFSPHSCSWTLVLVFCLGFRRDRVRTSRVWLSVGSLSCCLPHGVLGRHLLQLL